MNEQMINPTPSTLEGQGQQTRQKFSSFKSRAIPKSDIKPELEQEISFTFDHQQNEPVQAEPIHQHVQYE